MNTHEGHTATCLCCRHFILNASSGDETDFCNESVECNKGVFTEEYSPGEQDFHRLCLIGQDCREFEGR